MATWQLNICRRRPRSARYYEVFGREPDYPCWLSLLQFLLSGFKCIVCYGLLFLIIKWYVWPTVGLHLSQYALVQKTLNHSSFIIERLKSNRTLPFG